jgi:uncharacterized membrane protein YeaQ/YmgE (transglycosylase-associated protein family)
MGIILWIVFGAIVGWIASLIMKTKGGILMDIIVGIVGALIGGFVMNLFGGAGVVGFNLYSFLVALLGAVILLAIVKAISGKSVKAV